MDFGKKANSLGERVVCFGEELFLLFVLFAAAVGDSFKGGHV
jgi:hypothetical protein